MTPAPALPARRALLPRLLAALAALLLAGSAAAHAFLVFGTFETIPDPAPAGEPFTVRLTMVDQAQVPVEDAAVVIDVTPEAGGETRQFAFAEVGPGVYETEVSLPAGSYTALLRDQTFRQEEARATVPLATGGTATGAVEFLFPPTDVGGGGLGRWLIWVIGLPIVAGVVVTVAVLTRPAGGDADEDEQGGDEGTAGGPGRTG